MNSKPQYATRAEWRRLGYRPVKNAPMVVEARRRLVGAWFVEPVGTGRRGRP
jgi:hypothetical protein